MGSSLVHVYVYIYILVLLLTQVGGEIDYESYVRIKHKNTGTWLHLDKGTLQILTVSGDCCMRMTTYAKN